MEQDIKHRGTVEYIEKGHVVVRIMQTAACSTCLARKLCNSSESKEKMIDVYTSSYSNFEIGDEVMVVGSLSMGMTAVLFAYIIPLLGLIIILLAVGTLTGDEPLSALFSILFLLLYYILLFLYRNKLSKKFSFTIKHLN